MSHKAPTYPSNCLAFLNQKPHPSSTKASLCLNITVVGAGLGGLATAIALATSGHKVTVYEQAQALGEVSFHYYNGSEKLFIEYQVGAGIQIPPNSTRLLRRLGLDPYLKNYVTEPVSISFRRWESGNVIGLTQLVPNFMKDFDAPYYVIHRANFLAALHQRALDLGIVVNLDSRVASYDTEKPAIKFEDGSSIASDLVIAVDGMSSNCVPNDIFSLSKD